MVDDFYQAVTHPQWVSVTQSTRIENMHVLEVKRYVFFGFPHTS